MSTQNDTSLSPHGQAALSYARASVPVFPLKGKVPIEQPDTTAVDGTYIEKGKAGFHRATVDEARIRLWWTAFPDANIGTPTGHHVDDVTGQPNARPFDVLDVDADKGGHDSLSALIAEHGELPDTPYQITGTRGAHYLFKSNGTVRNSAGTLATGLDIRGSGGYIVVAPSIHPKTQEPYAWQQSPLGGEFAPWPDWLHETIAEGRRKAKATPGQRIPLGVQEATLMQIAGAMRRQGSTEAEILAALRVVSNERCDPPVQEHDLARMAASVCRYDPADPLITFAKTDAGNAERFAYVNEGRVIYCAPLRKWYAWDGRRWEPDETHAIDRLAIETIRLTGQRAMEMPGGNQGTPEQTAKAATVSWSLASESDKRLTDMVKRARGLLAVKPKELDAGPLKLCVKNGVIDLATGELRPHDPADRITKLAPVVYDPDATLPEWDAFLAQTLAGKEGLADFLQMAMGYSLTGLTDEEKLFFIYGPAGSGKSTFVEAFKAVLGDYAKTSDFDAFIKHQGAGGPRNDIARLNGARYVNSIEVEQGKALAEALVKTISGGDTVAARFLFAESVEFKPSLKLWLVANDAPAVNADDEGMWRRILRVPFDNKVPEDKQDPRVKALLTDPERAGAALLAWAIKGCIRWQETGKLMVPAVVKADTAKYRAEQDGLSGFLAESCELGPEHVTPVASVFDAYEGYWQTYGRYRRERRLTKDGLSKALKARHFEDTRPYVNGKQVRSWLGIGLKPLDWN